MIHAESPDAVYSFGGGIGADFNISQSPFVNVSDVVGQQPQPRPRGNNLAEGGVDVPHKFKIVSEQVSTHARGSYHDTGEIDFSSRSSI